LEKAAESIHAVTTVQMGRNYLQTPHMTSKQTRDSKTLAKTLEKDHFSQVTTQTHASYLQPDPSKGIVSSKNKPTI
jgi:hypothetical protein